MDDGENRIAALRKLLFSGDGGPLNRACAEQAQRDVEDWMRRNSQKE